MKKMRAYELEIKPYLDRDEIERKKKSVNEGEKMKKLIMIKKQDLRRKVMKKIKKTQKGAQLLYEKKAISSEMKENLKKIHEDGGKQFFCCLCYGPMIKPVGTVCGHTFCQMCLENALLYQDKCPVCRHQIREQGIKDLLAFAKLNEQYWKKYADKQYHLQARVYQEYQKKRRIKVQQMKEGLKVDIRNQSHIWCVGQIKRILNYGEKSQVLVSFESENSSFCSEVFEVSSERLAPKGFFTDRESIPKNPTRLRNIHNLGQHFSEFAILGLLDNEISFTLEAPLQFASFHSQ